MASEQADVVAHVLRSLMYCGGERITCQTTIRSPYAADAAAPAASPWSVTRTHHSCTKLRYVNQVDLRSRNGSEPAIVLRGRDGRLWTSVDVALPLDPGIQVGVPRSAHPTVRFHRPACGGYQPAAVDNLDVLQRTLVLL